ncbi:phospholipid phosphatase 3-like [Saccoglossus kowalevskii]|uniref:Lipid phosphate phosphohydrolase 3-like n=1 Tax=Saccoglossus kowalevskii TaxID=10224 RepID=A0ABM0H0N0_SACKO|nr:PREDICTED: lipid phosphate phosphohydrolase 3-like [Saccoglossus kowalevskii]
MQDIRCFNVFIDIAIFLGVEAIVLFPFFYDVLEFLPVRDTGFRCDDTDIQYPYTESIIPKLYVLVGAYAIAIFYLVGEILFYCCYTRNKDRDTPACIPCGCYVHLILVNIWRTIGFHIFAVNLTYIFVILGKKMVGRLRPNFLDICQANTTLYDCSEGWVDDSVCTGNDDLIEEAKESFPSYDASIVFCVAVYFVLYLEARWLWRGVGLMKPFIQAACLLGACFMSLLGVYQNAHFLSDAIAGAVLGGGIAVMTVFYFTSLFGSSHKRRLKREDEVEMNNYVVTNRNSAWVEQKM